LKSRSKWSVGINTFKEISGWTIRPFALLIFDEEKARRFPSCRYR